MKSFGKKATLKVIGIGLILQFAIQMLFSFIMVHFEISNSTNNMLEQELKQNWMVYGLLMVIVAPVIEESINRYLLFLWPLKILSRWQFFQKKKGVFICALVSSVLFASLHGELFLWPYVAIGLVYCWVAKKINITASICLHIINNGLLFWIMMAR